TTTLDVYSRCQSLRNSQKSAIAPGYDADLVLGNLENYAQVRCETLQTKCGWSSFEGWELTGWP
ncbi:MAG TPA: hypothetical protein V6D16_08300, partial [Candidatus Obscuribacterales bacterium]